MVSSCPLLPIDCTISSSSSYTGKPLINGSKTPKSLNQKTQHSSKVDVALIKYQLSISPSLPPFRVILSMSLMNAVLAIASLETSAPLVRCQSCLDLADRGQSSRKV